MAWRIAVLVGWLGALVGLVALEPDEATWYVAAGIPLTVLVGALVDRWWVTAVPYGILATLGVLSLVLGSGCPDCSDGDERPLIIWVVLVTFATPASTVLAIGVVFRRVWRPSRGQHT
ncbi:MAG TPA: hypothetical protein VGC98_00990 [Thermoleophilaceae bacterium]